ncbi:hotdog fold thioesterase [Sphingorhabdus sp.]|uniref:hotdog fold thioesterase n=1 Tax=Sphingorhabdus sp. TaxID=1902408 RepID=UPI0038FD0D0F
MMQKKSIWNEGSPDPVRLTALEQNSLSAHLGIEITAVGEDSITARMKVDNRTLQPHGRLHGGASVALAETVGSLAANLVLDPATHVAVGLDVNANHIRPVKSGYVFATATVESLGRTTQVWTIRIVDEQDRLVCLSRLTMAVIGIDKV